MKFEIPQYIKPFLWSYDTADLDIVNDKKRIITNILNLGTKKATDWVFSTYSKEDIEKSLLDQYKGEWNKKSLNYWALILGVDISNINTQRTV
jgi:hypothetical protein